MRKIKVVKWIEKINGEDIETDTISLLDLMIKRINPENAPKGFENFKIFSRLNKAFEKAKKLGELILEEQDYKFLKDRIESDIPAQWGGIPKAFEAIELFMEAKSTE